MKDHERITRKHHLCLERHRAHLDPHCGGICLLYLRVYQPSLTLPFEELVAKGIESIPERFRAKLKNVAILIEDAPSEEQLRSVGLRAADHDTLLGLYEGVSNLEGGHTHRDFPDRITIFRIPTLEEAEVEENVAQIVADTVRHEIAHHFGMDEDDVERAEKGSRCHVSSRWPRKILRKRGTSRA